MSSYLKSVELRALMVICLGFFSLLIPARAEAQGVQGLNETAVVLCQLIQFLRGRIGRAISLIVVLSVGVMFYMGEIKIQTIPIFVIGLGLFYGAEGIVYLILPSTVKGINGTAPDGTVFLPDKQYTPEEVVNIVCPALTM